MSFNVGDKVAFTQKTAIKDTTIPVTGTVTTVVQPGVYMIACNNLGLNIQVAEADLVAA